MQCPRCGLQNPPGISACQRCGLPVYSQSPPASPGGYNQPSPAPGGYSQASPAQSGYNPGEYSQGGYSQASPAQGGYSQGGYNAGGYEYAQGGGQQGYPQQAPSSPYATGPVAPYGSPAAGWPGAATKTSAGAPGLARFLLVLALIASIGYAIWAMTARRGIFVDFVDNRAVSLGRARTSDRTDTALLVIAGALVVVALAIWLIRVIAGRARGGALAVAGFVIAGLGLASVVVGLVLSGTVSNADTRVDEGRRAVTATIVTGSGFIAIAIGLLIGLLVVKARRSDDQSMQPMSTTPSPW